MKSNLILGIIAILAAQAVLGCGSDVGAAPVVHVSDAQRAKDLDNKALSTIRWLEAMPPDERQKSIDKIPQIAAALKGVTDPATKQKVDALNVHLP